MLKFSLTIMTLEHLALKIRSNLNLFAFHYIFKILIFLLSGIAYAGSIKKDINIDFSNLPSEFKSLKKIVELKLDAENEVQLSHKLKKTKLQIQDFCKMQGYYNAKINLSSEQNNTLLIKITPNQPIKISSFNKNIYGDSSNKKLIRELEEFSLGEYFKHKEYTRYKDKLISTLHAYGYYGAYFKKSEVVIDKENNSAAINLELVTQKAYKIKKFIITGSKLDESFIRKYISTDTPPIYTPNKLKTFYNILRQTDFFESIYLKPIFNHNKYSVTMLVKLKDKKKHLYEASLGFSTHSKVNISTRYKRNLTSSGAILDANAGYSNNNKELSLEYSKPGTNPKQTYKHLSFQVARNKDDGRISNNVNLNYYIQHKIHNYKWLDTISYGATLLKESFYTEGASKKDATHLIPTIKVKSKKTKEHLLGFTGQKLSLGFKVANKHFFSKNSMLQYKLNYLNSIGMGEKTKISLKVEHGATFVKDINELPFSLRFFTGGNNSVRGYPYNSIGPSKTFNDKEIPIGGRNKLNISLELEQSLHKQISGVIFYDTGDVSNDWRFDLHRGCGVGLRYNIGFAKLALEVALPLDYIQRKPRLHLSFKLGA